MLLLLNEQPVRAVAQTSITAIKHNTLLENIFLADLAALISVKFFILTFNLPPIFVKDTLSKQTNIPRQASALRIRRVMLLRRDILYNIYYRRNEAHSALAEVAGQTYKYACPARFPRELTVIPTVYIKSLSYSLRTLT